MVACHGNAFGGAVAGLIVVNTVFHIAFDTGNAAAIGRTAKIAHNTYSPLWLVPLGGTAVLWAQTTLNIRGTGGGLCPFLPSAIHIFRWAAIRK